MRGYLQNNSTNLNDTDKLDQFISGCIHSMKLFHISCDDIKSLNPVMLQRFLQGTLINTLDVYFRKLGLPDGPDGSVHHSSHHSVDDSDSDSEDEQNPKSKLRKSKQTTTLRRNGPARLHQLKIDLMNPLASLVTPSSIPRHEILQLQMYQAAIRAVVAKPNKFKDGMKCAICRQEHTFDKCPVLLDIPYLKKHFIAYCLLTNRTQRQMEVAVNQITAKDGCCRHQ